MVDQNVLDYVKETREKGFSDKAIKKAMLKQGYTEDMITEAFELSSPAVGAMPSKFFNRKILTIAVVLCVVCVSVFVVPSFIPNLKFTGLASQITPLGEEKYDVVDKDCNLDIRMALLEVNGQQKICYEEGSMGSTLQFLIENLGNVQVDGLKVVIISNQGVYEKDVDQVLAVDDVKSIQVDYDEKSLGEIAKVKIYPVSKTLIGQPRSCRDSMITATNIRNC